MSLHARSFSFRRAAPLPGWLLALAAIGFSTGCQILPEAQPDPTRYYLLTGMGASPPPQARSEGLNLGLRPIELPGFLRNSRSLVVARGPNEIEFRDYERWAEPLEAGLGRILRETLAQSDGVHRVLAFPFGFDHGRDYDLTIRIVHCEGAEMGGRRFVRFALTYEITHTTAAGETVRQGWFAAPEAEWDGQPASLAQLLGSAATEAGRAIAADLPARVSDRS